MRTAFVRLVGVVAAGSLLSGLWATAVERAGSAALAPSVESVVVLGDSVAAGEGARDGYRYRDRMLLPTWTRSDAAGEPRRPDCGRTDRSYGVVVARGLGAAVANLACSGATFDHGITLSARFDRARPDLVLLTAGANSVDFERVFAFCVLSSRGIGEADAEAVVRAPSVGEAVGTAIEATARRAVGAGSAGDRAACTASRPGAYLVRTVLDRLDDIAVRARELVAAVRARGERSGVMPRIVLTTYADPLPDRPASLVSCPDGAGLGTAQLAYLHSLLDRLNATLRDAVVDQVGVRVVDPDRAFSGHRWCDGDPWVYGPSIFAADPSSRVPFHPTAAGQRAIAAAVLAPDPSTGG